MRGCKTEQKYNKFFFMLFFSVKCGHHSHQESPPKIKSLRVNNMTRDEKVAKVDGSLIGST